MADSNPVVAAARAGARGSKTLGVILVFIGLLAIAAPLVAGTATVMFIGTCLLIGGVTMTFSAFRDAGAGLVVALLGVVTALAGLTLLARPIVGLASIALLLAIYFAIQGAFEIVVALQLRPAAGWVVYLFGGVLSLLLAYLMFSEWPLSGAWAVGVLVGVRLLFSGMTMIMIGGAASRMADALGGR